MKLAYPFSLYNYLNILLEHNDFLKFTDKVIMGFCILELCLLGKCISSRLDLDIIAILNTEIVQWENETILSLLSPLKYIIIFPFSFLQTLSGKAIYWKCLNLKTSSYNSQWFILPKFHLW